jgi:prevent-host-death family protein
MAIMNNGGIKMITESYSIAEARDQFASLVRQVEEQKQPVHVTRRGEAVAVILSAKDYALILAQQAQQDFWQSYQTWRQTWLVDEWTEESDPFETIRDQSEGRELPTWD